MQRLESVKMEKLDMLINARSFGCSPVKFAKKVLPAICALLVATPSQAASQPSGNGTIVLAPQVFYVSKSGNNTTGRSWQTAFNELNQIKWYEMSSGNPVTIYIDGGAKSMTYHTALNVPSYMIPPFAPANGAQTAIGPYPGPTSITITKDAAVALTVPVLNGPPVLPAGHGGQVIIDGQGKLDHCISVMRQNVTINGLAFRGIEVKGFTNYGIEAMAEPTTLTGIEVEGGSNFKPAGLYASNQYSFGTLSAKGLIVHNTQNGIYLAAGTQANIQLSWVFNDQYAAVGPLYSSGSGSVTSGINFNPYGASNGQPAAGSTISRCVLGPGLGVGLMAPKGLEIAMNNCLLLNAYSANVMQPLAAVIDPPGTGTAPMIPVSPSLSISNITSFMTRLNGNHQTHDCFYCPFNPEKLSVNNSVVFGGAVLLPPGRVGSNNIQDRTTGNTSALSATETDPNFIDRDIYNYGDEVSNRTLIRTNWTVRPHQLPPLGMIMPVGTAGSNVTSVKQLLSTPLSGAMPL